MTAFQITEKTLQSSAHKQFIGLILPTKQRQLFDLAPWSSATLNHWKPLELAEAQSRVDHPGGRGQCLGCCPGLLPPTLATSLELQRGRQGHSLLSPLLETIQQWQEGAELAEHFSDTAWHQLRIAERWHFRQGRG